MYAFDAVFSLGRFLASEDFDEDGEKELSEELGEALAAFVSAMLESEAIRGREDMLAEEAGHFWREVGTACLDEKRFMNLPGIILNKANSYPLFSTSIFSHEVSHFRESSQLSKS